MGLTSHKFAGWDERQEICKLLCQTHESDVHIIFLICLMWAFHLEVVKIKLLIKMWNFVCSNIKE